MKIVLHQLIYIYHLSHSKTYIYLANKLHYEINQTNSTSFRMFLSTNPMNILHTPDLDTITSLHQSTQTCDQYLYNLELR